MRVVMIGTGYVGLVSGACFADFGHKVVCIDKATSKIDALHRGEIPIFEPGLDEIVAENVRSGRLAFSTQFDAVADADVVFLAVGTPARRGDGHADLTYIYAAAEDVARHLSGYTLVVTKSTVPVGTGDEVEAIMRRAAPAADFDIASNPEFLREGAAIDDFKHPDRLVVGAETERAMDRFHELYRPLQMNGTPIVVTDRRTAELTKYAANAFLATKIAFTNEISDLCEQVGANVQHVVRGVGLDGRIGQKFMHPGPGYGGSCFPKDTLALSRTATLAETPVTIVDAVIAANARRKSAMADRIIAAAGGSLAGKTVAVLGVTFKPGTDDMRDAASLVIIPKLQAAGALVCAYDPEGAAEAQKHLSDVTFAPSLYACLEDADIGVILTEWDEFRALDLARVGRLLRQPILIDLRNIYAPEDMIGTGLTYHSLGRPAPARPRRLVPPSQWQSSDNSQMGVTPATQSATAPSEVAAEVERAVPFQPKRRSESARPAPKS